MGMFDSVMVPCPECGTKNEFQSKGGDCILAVYELDNCPPDVMSNINRHSPHTCARCGIAYEVSGTAPGVPVAVRPTVKRKAEDFHLGQEVMVEDADSFISSMATYLKGRIGVVTHIWPSDTPRDSPIRKNQVRVKWGKRNGRGVEKEMLMSPRDLRPAHDLAKD